MMGTYNLYASSSLAPCKVTNCLRQLYTGGQFAYGVEGRPERNGYGKYAKADGSVLVGQWEKNVLSGPRCYVNLVDQHVEYKGEMLSGNYHGQGEYSCAEYYFVGRFQEGRMSGPGVLLDALGRQWVYPASDTKPAVSDMPVVLPLVLKPDEMPADHCA
ncbi:hypothetical protein RvY_11800 [Ramazzottius varieornatus]|uniref:Uncharacterized protein n=1 Tax=Ramazzottius varieornatus TaxID=947166 RepID=A0A1D1VQ08_RAMVA|nr:hypothetical protein RvY_11800 [Ramazzottius varieornatus]